MIVEAEHLTKRYGTFTALDDVSFSLRPGEIVGLLGPNGAGKTTIILTLIGLISPTSGTVRVFGRGFERDREAILGAMNFCAPYLIFPARLTVHENLLVFARLYQVRQPKRRVDELLERFDLVPMRNRPVQRLSSGQHTRVALCKALLNEPRLLLLDEPTAFLDPQVAGTVRAALLELRQKNGTTIFYTTHNMVEAEEMCDRIVFLTRGRIIAQGTPLEITHALLDSRRDKPALREAFLQAAASTP